MLGPKGVHLWEVGLYTVTEKDFLGLADKKEEASRWNCIGGPEERSRTNGQERTDGNSMHSYFICPNVCSFCENFRRKRSSLTGVTT